MFKNLTHSFGSSKHQTRRRQTPMLWLEPLEDRRLLATFVVTSASDGPVAAAGDLPGSLRQAIFDANANPGGDRIEFGSTTFTGDSASLIRLTAGELEITEPLTLDGTTGTNVTITGDANGDDIILSGNITDVVASFGTTVGAANDLLDDNSRVLKFTAVTGELTLNHLTITGGRTTNEGASGGGIYTYSGAVTLRDSTVSGNSTAGRSAGGGGLYSSNGAVTLYDSTISGNSTAGIGSDGGGIGSFTGSVTLTNSTVSGNGTSGSYAEGGGINSRSGEITLTNSSVSGNGTTGELASYGGGIFSSTGTVTLTSSSVSGNSTSGLYSSVGGIAAQTVTLTNSTVSGNSTTGYRAYAGGVSGETVTLINSTVSGNSTSGDKAHSGGIAAFGALTLINSTVSGNSTSGAGANGGGISAFATVKLVSSTITGNLAKRGEGGGLFFDERQRSDDDPLPTIESSILADNVDNGVAPDLIIDIDQPLTITNSLIGNSFGSGIDSTSGSGNLLDVDPLLAPLAFNGGPTQTHASLPGGPAIDAGISSEAFDQRGFARVIDGDGDGTATADIGAFERQATEPLAIPPTILSIVRDEGGVLARPDLLNTFSVSFDANVNASADDLIIQNDTLGGDAVDSSTVTVKYDETTHTATWDFSSVTLEPAIYSFQLSSEIVSVANNLSVDGDADGNPGGALVETVFVTLPGDANLDGQVDVLDDAFTLVGNLGTTGGATWAQGDFNGDGNVDVLGDAFILVGNLGQSVIPPAAATTSASSPTTGQTPPAFTNSVAQINQLASSSIEQEDDRVTKKLSATPEQLVLAGSEDLDAAFASKSLFEDEFLT